MTKISPVAAVLAVLTLGLAAEANAWERSATVSGPRGTASVTGSGSCGGGTCSRSVTRTGTYAGGTVTRSYSVTGVAPHPYGVRRVYVAPYPYGVRRVYVAPRVYVVPHGVTVTGTVSHTHPETSTTVSGSVEVTR